MKNSGIGGQAVMEGIMMRNKDQYSIGVRKPDQTIEVKTEPYKGIVSNENLYKIPIFRGVLSFIESLVVGIRCLLYSASFFEEEEEEKEKNDKKKKEIETDPVKAEAKKKREEKVFMFGVVAVSLVMAVVIFMLVPFFLTDLLSKVIKEKWIISFLEALIRVAIFLIYLLLISRMKDIQRTFMYHGAEHKCINCIEHGLPLNVENVMKSSRLHKRCGTSFLFFVIIISAIAMMFIQADTRIMKIVIRLALVPVIAGISYEVIRLAGRSENKLVCILSKPGMGLQKLTTKEPDESQAEVAIAAVEAVFDWKTWQKENMGESDGQYGC